MHHSLLCVTSLHKVADTLTDLVESGDVEVAATIVDDMIEDMATSPTFTEGVLTDDPEDVEEMKQNVEKVEEAVVSVLVVAGTDLVGEDKERFDESKSKIDCLFALLKSIGGDSSFTCDG